jgi:hypothetical protein
MAVRQQPGQQRQPGAVRRAELAGPAVVRVSRRRPRVPQPPAAEAVELGQLAFRVDVKKRMSSLGVIQGNDLSLISSSSVKTRVATPKPQTAPTSP